jgi:hypothetical protein
MKNIRWCWALSVIQIVVAVSLFLYSPYQYLVRVRASGIVNNPEYFLNNWPPPAMRVSQAINFPAVVLDSPFRFALRRSHMLFYENNSRYGYVSLGINDVVFFLWVGMLWYWVGMRIDQTLGQMQKRNWPRNVIFAGLSCGVLFAIACAVYGIKLVGVQRESAYQVAPFGILWAVLLGCYFGRELALRLRSPGITL